MREEGKNPRKTEAMQNSTPKLILQKQRYCLFFLPYSLSNYAVVLGFFLTKDCKVNPIKNFHFSIIYNER